MTTPGAPDAAAPEARPDPLAQVFSTASQRIGDPELAEMERGDVAATAIGIADTLEAIDRGETAATAVQRAFLSGALAALRGVLIADQNR